MVTNSFPFLRNDLAFDLSGYVFVLINDLATAAQSELHSESDWVVVRTWESWGSLAMSSAGPSAT